MNVAIDLGNTYAKIGLFKKKLLIESRNKVAPENIVKTLNLFNIKKIIIANVGKERSNLYKKLISQYTVLNFNHQTPIPIKHQYLTPETLGMDRLAAVIGSFVLYPHQNNLVIDMGTCITYDFIDKNGEYLGGSISPGMTMRLKALHHFTARLPLIKEIMYTNLFGNSTETCIESGVTYGIESEIKGFIRGYKKKYCPLNILICGGDATYLKNKIKNCIFVHSNLTLYGLNEILNWNE